VLRVTDDLSAGGSSDSVAHPILLYDGVCGLCNRFVQFILRRDPTAIFRFASLQSPLAASILQRHNVNPTDLDTVYVVINHDGATETLLSRSDAVLFVLQQLSKPYRSAAAILRLIPSPLRNWTYNAIARNRYQVCGRHDSCPLPTAANRARFLDQ
jgi:predicted DCC family thiol-disulfide oxidoreductase YuxK